MTLGKITAIARQWIGTPFMPDAALKQAGCDCYGLLRGVWAENSGQALPPLPVRARADWQMLRGCWPVYYESLLKFARPLVVGSEQAGDILLFALTGGALVHAGIKADDTTFVHALHTRGVVTARFADTWQRRHRQSLRFID